MKIDTGYRMYFRIPGTIYSLGSARSADGLAWTREPGIRIRDAREFAAIRLSGDAIVIYYAESYPGFTEIRSARSIDGLTFVMEPGVRLRPGDHPDSDPLESGRILTTSILEFPGNLLRMYYQGSPSKIINEEARVFSAAAQLPITAQLDIRPGACPNPFNPKSRGVIRATVLGTRYFDVGAIDFSSLALERVQPRSSRIHDSSSTTPDDGDCPCASSGPDGYDDLICTFDTEALARALGPVRRGEVKEITLIGSLVDGTPFSGTDCVLIVGRVRDAGEPGPEAREGN